MPGESKSSPRRIEAKERQRQALELRKAGVTLQKIAETVGFRSKQAAHDSIRRALAEIPYLAAQQLRELDLERLDQLLFAVWSRALQGDGDAINSVLRILAQRARLLGLDAPVKVAADVNLKQEIRYDFSGVSTDALDHALAVIEAGRLNRN